MSEETRIIELPVIEPDYDGLVETWTQKLATPAGSLRFFKDQALALDQAATYRGGLFPITTGGGKTLLSMCLPAAVGISPSRVVVLCPPGLEAEAAAEREGYLEHFNIEPDDTSVMYVPYSILSREQGVTLLDELAPLMIIADEAHCLRNKNSARTNRFLKYMKANPGVVFVAMSATFTVSSLNDYAHLAALALRDNSPLPLSYVRTEAWARCIDVNPRTPAAGNDWAIISPLMSAFGEKGVVPNGRKYAREAYRARLRTCPGVVVSEGDSCDQPLYVQMLTDIPMPKSIKAAIKEAKAGLVLPNGSDIDSPMHAAEKQKQLSLGFFYFHDWPNGEPDNEWIYAKREYQSQLMRFVSRGRKGLDTPFLVERRLREGDLGHAQLEAAWEAWRPVMHRPAPPQGLCWMDTSVMEWLAVFARVEAEDKGPTIIWTGHDAEAAWFGAQGFTVATIGQRPPDVSECKGGILVCSIASHGTGYNLQKFGVHIVISPPANGGRWQQLAGRGHRAGRTEPVYLYIAQHTSPFRSSWRTAVNQAMYIKETTGLQQKILSLEAMP
jgi:hypothetical protein